MPRRAATERTHPAAAQLDTLNTRALLELMHREDRRAGRAAGTQLETIARIVETVVARLRQGGHLHYFGAGTSGRLAMLDAVECPPTFGVPADLVTAHLAGGGRAMQEATESAEDNEERGRLEAMEAGIGAGDVAIGISASGDTPYVRGALAQAQANGAFTAAITCVPRSSLGSSTAEAVILQVGPELIAGSTRLKAGTAQKMVLNMISTATFVRLGHAFRGQMVDVRPSNAKLRARAIRIIKEATGCSEQAAAKALAESGDRARLAIVMLALRIPRAAAEAKLAEHGDNLREVLEARTDGL